MRRIVSVYLAGPDLWFPDGQGLIARKRELCEEAGFIGVSGRETATVEREPNEAMAREVYADTLVRLRSCEAVIANLTPWRGAGCDPGAAFECGFAAALGLPVFAYANLYSADEADHRTRVELMLGGGETDDGRLLDPDGCEVEDFGLPEALMLWAEARTFAQVVTDAPWSDLSGFEACLEAMAEYAA